ncbi:MAG: hypothetical protein WBB01_22635 [Phormidesmis sp.]
MALKYNDDHSASKRPSASAKDSHSAGGVPTRRVTAPASGVPGSRVPGSKFSDPKPSDPKFPDSKFSDGVSDELTPNEEALHQLSPLERRSGLFGIRWLSSWPIVVLLLFGILGTVGTTAIVSLFRIPSLPNCRAVFWPTASASLRIQCAETYAAQGSVKNLLAAIALVDQLPDDHPLRFDINLRIEDWATQVLDLAERSFEAGELEEAISTAQKIPAKTSAAEAVQARIERWQKIWKEGEDTFDTAVAKLKGKDFAGAFSLLVNLLDVDNEYWATVKYGELTKLITQAREDSRQMSEALDLAKQGTVKGFTEALKRLKEIDAESVFYAEAQGKRKSIARQMLQASEDLLADRSLSEAEAMLSAIPRDTGLNREVADFQIFIAAYQQAWTNSMGGLESAINRMKTLGKDRPRYAQGQRLIAQWEGELRNLDLLNQAEERSGRGSIDDLVGAIALARQVSRNSPQWDQAAKKIDQWQTRVETVQDRPILERADRLAAVGTPDNLRAAIQEARKISSGRTLASEASERIDTWTGRIQRIEDQPTLDQARQQAQTGNLAGAIATASRIGEGRALYDAAQEDIAEWRSQEDGRLRLSEAVSAASSDSTEALAEAIKIAQRVPTQSSSRARADRQINRWSWDLLSQAETISVENLGRAIALARAIPASAEAYSAAQVRISTWQTSLQQDSGFPASGLETAPRPAAETGENELPSRLELTPGE